VNQRFHGPVQRGIPVTDLIVVADDGTTGTIVQFRPSADLRTMPVPATNALARLTESWPHLSVDTTDERIS